jgi:hypothetical protein
MHFQAQDLRVMTKISCEKFDIVSMMILTKNQW